MDFIIGLLLTQKGLGIGVGDINQLIKSAKFLYVKITCTTFQFGMIYLEAVVLVCCADLYYL